ncbi:hypothetical protein D3C71_1480970 [compost metagenome]
MHLHSFIYEKGKGLEISPIDIRVIQKRLQSIHQISEDKILYHLIGLFPAMDIGVVILYEGILKRPEAVREFQCNTKGNRIPLKLDTYRHKSKLKRTYEYIRRENFKKYRLLRNL